jgi:hypothetical protein
MIDHMKLFWLELTETKTRKVLLLLLVLVILSAFLIGCAPVEKSEENSLPDNCELVQKQTGANEFTFQTFICHSNGINYIVVRSSGTIDMEILP